MTRHRIRWIALGLLGIGGLLVVLLFVAVFRSDAGCNELVQFGFARRDCYLLRSPLIWFARERPRFPASASQIAPLALPDDVSAQDIWETDTTAGSAVAKQKTGGYVSFDLTWGERTPIERNTLAYVEEGEPFIGEFELGLFMPNPPKYEITCLVDFVQHPCTPDVLINQKVALETEGIIKVPVRIEGLSRGLHDIVVAVLGDLDDALHQAQDPTIFPDKYGGFGTAPQIALRKNVAVKGDLTPRAVNYEHPRLELYWTQAEGLVLSPQLMPWERRWGGGYPLSQPLKATPRQPLKLYLHLFNPADSRVEYAIAAFIDRSQIPITYKGVPRIPFYVTAKAGAWYPIPIEITAPTESGWHEVLILASPDPFQRVDILPVPENSRNSFLGEFGLHATAILVEVSEE